MRQRLAAAAAAMAALEGSDEEDEEARRWEEEEERKAREEGERRWLAREREIEEERVEREAWRLLEEKRRGEVEETVSTTAGSWAMSRTQAGQRIPAGWTRGQEVSLHHIHWFAEFTSMESLLSSGTVVRMVRITRTRPRICLLLLVVSARQCRNT